MMLFFLLRVVFPYIYINVSMCFPIFRMIKREPLVFENRGSTEEEYGTEVQTDY